MGANWNRHTDFCQSFIKNFQAVSKISKIFVKGKGWTCTPSFPPFMCEVLSEEKAPYNSLKSNQ